MTELLSSTGESLNFICKTTSEATQSDNYSHILHKALQYNILQVYAQFFNTNFQGISLVVHIPVGADHTAVGTDNSMPPIYH